MTADEQLLAMLPAAFRTRDVESGQGLRALLAVLESELDRLRRETETLYDNWFVETCEEWLVPYIGELVGTRGLRSVGSSDFSLRGYVANAVARRRRTGTAAATEQLARDVTGYPVRAQELYALTATTLADDHVRGQDHPTIVPATPSRHDRVRLASLGTADLRDVDALAELDGPFDQHVHTADLRGPADGQAHENLPNLALHLFRVRSRPLGWVTAREVPGQPGLLRIDPCGRDRPLFTRTEDEDDITALAGPEHVPRLLSRLELDALVRELATLPVAVRTTDDAAPVELAVEACDLSGAAPSHRPATGTAAVDPVLGLVAVHEDDVPPGHRVEVTSAYGFPGDVGAGPHDRTTRVAAQLRTGAGGRDEVVTPTDVWWVAAEQTAPPDPDQVGTLAAAVAAWNTAIAGRTPDERAASIGLILLGDDRTQAPPDPIELPDGARLHVVAARRPEDADLGAGPLPGAVTTGVRPHVAGDLRVQGTSADGVARAGGLACSGVLLEGTVRVEPGDLELLDLADCTVVPPPDGGAPRPAVRITGDNPRLEIEVAHCLLAGRVVSAEPIASLTARDSLVLAAHDGVDDGSPRAVSLPGAGVDLVGCSVVGRIRARTLDASDCILDPGAGAPGLLLDLEITQQGCLRYSWVPDTATSPRRHRCQPDRALAALLLDPALAGDAPALSRARSRTRARLQPQYAGTTLGDPGLHLLVVDTDPALRTAASDGGEPGVWHHLEHAPRLANLAAALRTNLRFGLRVAVVEHV